MSEKVSIIINAETDKRYLLRCLYSVKKQSFNNFEVTIIGAYDKKIDFSDDIFKNIDISLLQNSSIYGVFSQAKGKYVFFCDSSSILSFGLIRNLYNDIESDGKCVVSKQCIIKDNSEPEQIANPLSLSGKMFATTNAIEIFASCGKDISTFDFCISYYDMYGLNHESDGAYLYYTNKPSLLFFDKEADDIFYKKLIRLMADSTVYTDGLFYVLNRWINCPVCGDLCKEEKVLFASLAFINNLEVQYGIFQNYIKPLHVSILSKKGYEKKFYVISDFVINNYKNGNYDIITIVKDELHINKKELSFLLNKKYGDYIFSYKRLNTAYQNSPKISDTTPMKGYELSQYIVDQYKSGGLGFKTIVKSISAYTKNKLKLSKG